MDVYVNLRFPNAKASAIQAVRVAESFARVGVATTLRYRDGAMPAGAWRSTYGVAPAFAPCRYPGLYVRGRRLPLVNDAATRAAFTVRLLGRGDRILYGWNPGGFPIGFFIALRRRLGCRRPLIACEAHEGKDWTGTRVGDADVVVAVSEAARRSLLAVGVGAERIIVAHDGVDLRPYDALRGTPKRELRGRLGLPVHGPLAVFTGQLYRGRGAETTLDALASLPGSRLAFVGGRAEDRDRVRRYAERAGAAERVVFVEERPPAEIPPYQLAADVLLMPYGSTLPTREWCSPMKLFEYMAAGVPIVASDLPVFHEVAAAGREIVYVPPDDARALADAIARILGDPREATAIGGGALARVRGFGWDERARRIYDFCLRRAAAARTSA